MTVRRVTVVAAGAAALVLVLAGCAGIRSERQGKQVGEAICDLRDASSADEAQRQIEKIEEDVADARRITGVAVNQDVRRINEQLSDLAEHAVQGNDALLDQDLAVIRRNLSQAIDDTDGNVQRYYQGMRQGLDSCFDG